MNPTAAAKRACARDALDRRVKPSFHSRFCCTFGFISRRDIRRRPHPSHIHEENPPLGEAGEGAQLDANTHLQTRVSRCANTSEPAYKHLWAHEAAVQRVRWSLQHFLH